MERNLKKLLSVISRFGILYAIKSVMRILISDFVYALNYINHKKNGDFIKEVILNSKLPIVLYPPYHDFNLPLYQRPQHLASSLSQHYLYLFHSYGVYDKLKGIKSIKQNLFILPKEVYSTSLKTKSPSKKILFIYSHPFKAFDEKLLNQYIKNGDIIVYDYLDELNEEVFCHVNADALKRHQFVLGCKDVILFFTASKLQEEIRKYRPCLSNTYFVPNAVDINHFTRPKNPIPSLEFLKNKKVIGYFGAFASWVDYDLIHRIAMIGEDYHVLLLGHIFDDRFGKSNLHKTGNITILGPIKYDVLPDYASYFDVSIIPFLVNDTTLSTSPIKLFEYMALGKPIVSTDLPECRKYKSSLIAKSHDEFISLIQTAFTIPEHDEYFRIMKKESEENTWEERKNVIVNAIDARLSVNAASVES